MVPAKGVERWLTQRLSHRLGTGPRGGDGVCAGVRFLQPISLVSLLLGRERDDAWDPDRLVWPLLATIDASLGEPWCPALSLHLGHGRDGEAGELRRNRRYSVAIRLAHLFASYAVQRPHAGHRLARGPRHRRRRRAARRRPGLAGRAVAAAARADPRGPARRAPPAHRSRGSTPAATGSTCPARLSLFGHTRLPVTEVELLGGARPAPRRTPLAAAALARAVGRAGRPRRRGGPRRRHLRRPGRAPAARLARPRRPRAAAHPAHGRLPRGRPGRAPARRAGHPARLAPARPARQPRPDRRGARGPRTSPSGDRSLQVHACHGAARQVDVLREVLVGLLQDDPTLEPRDILVMCPDIETFAPLVSAGFGLAPADGTTDGGRVGHPAHQLRVRLADRALTSTNPLLQPGRPAARAERRPGHRLRRARPRRQRAVPAPVRLHRRRPRPARPLGGRHRRAVGARRRVAAAVLDGALRQQHLAGRARPGAARRRDERRRPPPPRARAAARRRRQQRDRPGRPAGRAARPARRLPGRAGVGDHASPSGWTRCAAASATSPRSAATTPGSCRSSSASWPGRRPRPTAGGPELRLADVRALLESRLAGRPTRANFRTGTLTVCTMVPMRSVPHRVVCLVGLDDGVFPRRDTRRRRRRPGPPPAHRRARPAQRGPPAAPRRAAGRDRARRHHLHRRQRELRRAPAPRRTPRRAARRRRPHHRRRRCARRS